MQLKWMKIENFLSIGEGEISFDKPGLVLVEGVNEDSPSSISNGAGKSSLYDAIHWAFWGKTKRGVSGDDVVNLTTKKNCAVRVAFDDFMVLRARKHEEHENRLIVFQAIPDAPFWKDISKGTTKETQALLEDILKMNELTFGKIAHFGQGDVKNFASLTDKEQKQVFEQALGLEFLQDTLEKIKNFKSRKRLDADMLKANVTSMEIELDGLAEKIRFLGEAADQLKAKQRGEEERYQEEIKAMEEELSEVSAKQTETMEDHSAKLKEYEEARATLDKLRKTAQELQAEHNRARSKYDQAVNELRRKQGDIAKRLEGLKSMDEKVGKPCNECGKPYTEADIAPAKARLADTIRQEHAALKEVKPQAEEKAERVRSLEGLASQLNAKLADLERRVHELSKFQALASTGDIYKEQADRLGRAIIKAKGQLKGLQEKREDPYAEDTKKAQSTHVRLESEIADIKKDICLMEEELALTGMLEQIFGNGGLKSYLMDNITPELNKAVNKYLAVLDDIEVEISTMTKLKSGEFRDRFSVKVNNRHGAAVYDGNSGGEKQKINLAIALGFNSVVRRAVENTLNVLWLDEPFESLDEGSAEKVLELCKMLDMQNIFVITHNPGIKELIPNRLVVWKKGGKAEIS